MYYDINAGRPVEVTQFIYGQGNEIKHGRFLQWIYDGQHDRVKAIVEYDDGTCGCYDMTKIKFLPWPEVKMEDILTKGAPI